MGWKCVTKNGNAKDPCERCSKTQKEALQNAPCERKALVKGSLQKVPCKRMLNKVLPKRLCCKRCLDKQVLKNVPCKRCQTICFSEWAFLEQHMFAVMEQSITYLLKLCMFLIWFFITSETKHLDLNFELFLISNLIFLSWFWPLFLISKKVDLRARSRWFAESWF